MPVSSDPNVRVVFLGGVGEVGRNMACIELDGRILLVDVGLSFPSADMFGIDLVLPDFDYVRERADRIEAVVLTHGHEDHIGALPYLLRELTDIPVYGTAFTLALLEGKLEEHGVADRCELHVVTPGEGTTTVGPFSMRFLRVTHSIPDGMAVVVDTPFGSILHTGDFKIDQTPLDGRPDRPARPGRGGERQRRPPAPVRLDQRRGGRLHARASGASARSCIASSRRRRTSSWWRASPATSTASSRS